MYFCKPFMENEQELYEKFDIKNASLKNGSNRLDYKLDNRFFKELHEDDETKGSFDVHLELEKQTSLMSLLFKVKGAFSGDCDRCLDPVRTECSFTSELVIKFTDEEAEDTDEIVYLPKDFEVFNIGHVLYEMIIVHAPLKMVHEDESDCNREMIEYLKLNSKNEAEVDPRWSELMKLKN